MLLKSVELCMRVGKNGVGLPAAVVQGDCGSSSVRVDGISGKGKGLKAMQNARINDGSVMVRINITEAALLEVL